MSIISPTEDLSKEHGLLNRLLIIYEECIRRINKNISLNIRLINESAQIIQVFLHEYHEKNEETYIFPELLSTEYRATVETLICQHAFGRHLTQNILRLTESLDKFEPKVAKYMGDFIAMYRPHEAREDSEIFPKFRTVVTQKYLDKLAVIFEESEDKKLGQHGYTRILNQVKKIEQELGLNLVC